MVIDAELEEMRSYDEPDDLDGTSQAVVNFAFVDPHATRIIFLNPPYPLIASARPGNLSAWFDVAFSPRGQRERQFLKQRLTCFNVSVPETSDFPWPTG